MPLFLNREINTSNARLALRRLAGAVAIGAALAGCVPTNSAAPRTAPRPMSAPEGLGEENRSGESRAMQAYFAQVETMLLDQGLLRQDVAPRDAPFGRRQLVDNFVHIALYDEYSNRGGTFVASTTKSRLRRWEQPVTIGVEFGPTVPPAQRRKDSAAITAFAGQIGRATRHPVRVVPSGGNFSVLVLNEDERRNGAKRLRELVPGIDAASVNAITDLPPTTFCVVFAFSDGRSASYSRAVAVIRAEHPDRLRMSCVHEELAQGMGLANDYPRARPSIFNDDEEFALLTRHDELLLQILYDPRLRPGMTEAEARPIVEDIASELLGADS
ncbi:DUF2927 domain-containing protein [Sedimentimonas flavescens]|uniref:DUF2927 domain-containing protein n=1 Tax=Sedimentimonas flavescens TaxID=2851012 RepID=UPI0021A934D6|nr:DUF2927 domain-containing protein [Sedimentimonas flavescens]MCT2539134.1 DUF2927 domain-containing protein [Sedimentimonas flavescens]